ncbi:hypothetical protein GF339_16680 [candidate division KSB3 bacterium]|uniref:Uncharacterized protein n=1 Tax=candidate division KSB3 bacterium TaxID=2044937 RepID=A0A9D5JY39_9BACT|nr:hypothetical protein [candidate division KSB3 bacterium]MBD3326225.1 hypothetical protein [candidate division KSB3 bacterium]
MGWLKNLFSGGSQAPRDETSEAVFIYSQCEKCGERFRNRIDKQHDLMRNYADTGPAYRAHKEILGAKCRNVILVDLEFDQQKQLVDKLIERGHFITREEFEPPEDSAS